MQDKSSRTVNLAVISYGDIALSQPLPTIASHPHARLLAVCDNDAQRGEVAANAFGAPRPETDYRKVLDDSVVEAVIIVTPGEAGATRSSSRHPPPRLGQ